MSGLHNLLNVTGGESSDESILVLNGSGENNPIYMEFIARNLGYPVIIEITISNNEENYDDYYPFSLLETVIG